MGNIKNLEVWTEAKDLAVFTYLKTNDGKISRDYGLRDQMRRASVSVPSNIAEGEESGRNRKAIYFFYISKGSLAELLTQVNIVMSINNIDEEVFDLFTQKIETLSAKQRKLIQFRENELGKSGKKVD